MDNKLSETFHLKLLLSYKQKEDQKTLEQKTTRSFEFYLRHSQIYDLLIT